MLSVGDLFDSYGRKAQLYPSLAVAFPPLITLLALFPRLMTIQNTIGGLVISCGVLHVLSNLARQAGRRKQSEIFPDGLPTDKFLRHRDNRIDVQTKARYKAYLVAHVKGLAFPTEQEEQASPKAADGAYRSAVKWLLENTRSNKRVLQENAAYGFRRNLYGVRAIGLSISIVVGILAAFLLYRDHALAVYEYPVEAVAAVGLDLLVAPIIWSACITRRFVEAGADGYALALLGCCDVAAPRKPSTH